MKAYAFLLITLYCSINQALDFRIDASSLPASILKLDAPSQYAYQFVTRTCHHWLKGFSQVAKSEFVELGKTMVQLDDVIKNYETSDLKRRFDENGIGLELSVLLNSLGFYIGLKECFGDQQMYQNMYVATLIAGDVLGLNSMLALSILAPLRMGRWLLGLLKNMGSRISPSLDNPYFHRFLAVGSVAAVSAVAVAPVIQRGQQLVERQKQLENQKLVTRRGYEASIAEIDAVLLDLNKAVRFEQVTKQELSEAEAIRSQLLGQREHYIFLISKLNNK